MSWLTKITLIRAKKIAAVPEEIIEALSMSITRSRASLRDGRLTNSSPRELNMNAENALWAAVIVLAGH